MIALGKHPLPTSFLFPFPLQTKKSCELTIFSSGIRCSKKPTLVAVWSNSDPVIAESVRTCDLIFPVDEGENPFLTDSVRSANFTEVKGFIFAILFASMGILIFLQAPSSLH